MSTYNGEQYVREQIDSILHQEGVDVFLLIRDDGSKDSTLSILEEYCKNYKNVKYYQDKNVGPANSFIDLIIKADYCDYYAFADQDDVWESNKLAVGIDKLNTLDQSRPAMYYSNLKIVDENLQFCRMSHSKPQLPRNKYTAIIDNMSTGCTTVFNRAAAESVKKHPPKYCAMHDAWMYLVCSLYGSLVYDFDGYIQYRQHSKNVVGTYLKRKTIKNYYYKIKRLLNKKNQPRYVNAINFYDAYENDLDEKDREKVLKLVNYKKSFKNKMKLLFDKDIKATGFWLNLRYRFLILVGNV